MNENNVNVPLLRKAVEWAEAEASATSGGGWLQESWAVGMVAEEVVDLDGRTFRPLTCGTSFCIAGWACHEAGDTFIVSAERSQPGEEKDFASVLTSDGHIADVEDRAAELLGLVHQEHAWELFEPDNTIEDVRRIAEHLAGERL